MAPDELVRWLETTDVSQREKLARVRELVETIRAFPDEKWQLAIRTIKKRLGSPKIAADVAAIVLDLTRDRVARPAPVAVVEAAPVHYVGLTDDDRATALEAAIAADPEAQGPYTVYGDYLTSIGDAFGELIAIGHALAKNTTHKAMLARWTELLALHGRTIWGPIVRPPHGIRGAVNEIDWYMGFIRGCRVTAHPTLGPPLDETLRALLDDPAPGRFIQTLEVPSSNGGFEPVARVLAERPRPTLRTLLMGSMYGRIGDISAMWPALEHLRVLSLEGRGPIFGTVHAPALAKFAIQFGNADAGENSLVMLAPILDGNLPNLRSLAIGNYDNSDELVVALVRSKLLPQLVELDLGQGTLGPKGAETLLAHRDQLSHLQRLNLEENFLPADTKLAELGNVQLGDQRVADEDQRVPAQWE